MAQKGERAKKLDSLTKTAVNQIRASLKARGIKVDEVDGPSESDMELRGLQELQAIAASLKADDDAKAPVTTGTDYAASAGKDAKGSK